MSTYILEKDTKIKDLNLDVIRQALLKADEANVIALAPYQAFLMHCTAITPSQRTMEIVTKPR